MRKLNIYLPREVHSALKEESVSKKLRMSEVVRRHIDDYISRTENSVIFEPTKQPRRTELQRTNLYLSPEQMTYIDDCTEKLDCTKADLIRFILALKTDLMHTRNPEK